MTRHVTLTGLTLYPVKSCAGIPVERADALARGLRHDRRWMLVDEHGAFLTQRRHPRLARIHPELTGASLRLSWDGPGPAPIELLLGETGPSQGRRVRVWRDELDAHDLGEDVAAWCTEVLQMSCRLVRMPEGAGRVVRASALALFSGHDIDPHVSFADGYPYLLLSEASLARINEDLSDPVDMRRFRPNLVIDAPGMEAFAEDEWSMLRRADGLTFCITSACSRCSVITVDPDRGVLAGPQPTKALARYRLRDQEVYVGQNMVVVGSGEVRVGDVFEVVA
ncbi:MAG: MOSC N-terminal beta barrel domain-containing protein [Myxococcota bacterium]